MDKSVYLWIPVVCNIVACLVIPFVGEWSDRIGRRPPMIVGSLVAGLLSFAYLYAISLRHVPLAFVLSVLMWGVIYQGYNAVFPSFYPELFPTRARVSGIAIAQNVGTMLTALLPALFTSVAPPGSTNVPIVIGALAFGVTVKATRRGVLKAGFGLGAAALSAPLFTQRPPRPPRREASPMSST